MRTNYTLHHLWSAYQDGLAEGSEEGYNEAKAEIKQGGVDIEDIPINKDDLISYITPVHVFVDLPPTAMFCNGKQGVLTLKNGGKVICEFAIHQVLDLIQMKKL